MVVTISLSSDTIGGDSVDISLMKIPGVPSPENSSSETSAAVGFSVWPSVDKVLYDVTGFDVTSIKLGVDPSECVLLLSGMASSTMGTTSSTPEKVVIGTVVDAAVLSDVFSTPSCFSGMLPAGVETSRLTIGWLD